MPTPQPKPAGCVAGPMPEYHTCFYGMCGKPAAYHAHSVASERYCCDHKVHLRWAVQRLLVDADSVTVDKLQPLNG